VNVSISARLTDHRLHVSEEGAVHPAKSLHKQNTARVGDEREAMRELVRRLGVVREEAGRVAVAQKNAENLHVLQRRLNTTRHDIRDHLEAEPRGRMRDDCL
jgi:hypothetical protein